MLLFSLYRQMQKNEVQTRDACPYVISSWCQMRQKFFFDYLLPTDIAYCFKYNVILCQLFFKQTSAVKTLPPHNPISLTLSFFLYIPMNFQFDLFVLTEFLFFSVAIRNVQLTTFSLYSSIWITRLLLLFNQLFLFKFSSSFFFQFPRIKANVELSPS